MAPKKTQAAKSLPKTGTTNLIGHNSRMTIEYCDPKQLTGYDRQLRVPSKTQIEKTKRFLIHFKDVIPVVIDTKDTVVIGPQLVEAAFELGLKEIPCVRIEHLDEPDIRMLRIAYDRLAEDAEWDRDALRLEFEELKMDFPNIDLTLTNFDIDEINLILDLDHPDTDPLDDTPEIDNGPAVTKDGDLWIMGDHKLLCGDSLNATNYSILMQNEKAQMVFTDAPYNVKIDGHVGNSGEVKHEEFAMASGEMTDDEFIDFLTVSHKHMADNSVDGAILFSCMDWRHITHIITASTKAKLEIINMCVWGKDNGGMGSLYRSQHELVFVFKKGAAKHINNVQLGANGRYRTNVWNYPGVNSFGNGRMDELKLHPTVKPVAMIIDAIKDCSKRGGIILDPFGGAGTTLIAAEKTARKARLIELSLQYCDVAIRRWQVLTGQDAVHAESGKTFNETQTEK